MTISFSLHKGESAEHTLYFPIVSRQTIDLILAHFITLDQSVNISINIDPLHIHVHTSLNTPAIFKAALDIVLSTSPASSQVAEENSQVIDNTAEEVVEDLISTETQNPVDELLEDAASPRTQYIKDISNTKLTSHDKSMYLNTAIDDTDVVSSMCDYLDIILKDTFTTFLTDFIYVVVELLRFSQKYRLKLEEQAAFIRQSMEQYTKTHNFYDAEVEIMISTVTVEMINTLMMVDSGIIQIKKRKSRCIPLLCS